MIIYPDIIKEVFMKTSLILALSLFMAANLVGLDLNIPTVKTVPPVKDVAKNVEKKADVQKVSAGNTADVDLQVLTKKLKNVQNEKGPIVFKTGSAVLDAAKCETTMKTTADIIKAFPGYIIQIDGHTDSVGNAKANKELSQKRAESVKAYLQSKYGVAANRLTAKGFGSSQPIADNTTKAGQAKNRRVDFTVTRMK
jgi:outer membrane protein OmpA-like peptidoglycan-associated protein